MGDFNGDGDPDLAVADQSPGEILVLLGGAGGTFTGPTESLDQPTAALSAVAVGDFNRDGDPDLAVANVNPSSVSVLLGSTAAAASAGPTNFAAGSTPPRWRWPTSTATASLTWRSPRHSTLTTSRCC